MKTVYLFLAALLLATSQLSAQTWDWTHPEPNGTTEQNNNVYLGDEADVAHSVKTDAAGNVYVLGDFSDSLYLNNIFRESGAGSYLAKYDSTGKLLWYKTIVPSDYNNNKMIKATAFTVNAQGVFVTGKYYGSYYKSYDCTTGNNTGVDFSYKIGSFAFTSARNDVGYFITKFNSSGSVVWNKTATQAPCNADGGQPGIAQVDYNPLITSDKSNNVIASFVIISNIPTVTINSDVIQLNPNQSNLNPYQLVVTKYNSGGTLQWSNYAGGGSSNSGGCGGAGYIQDCNSTIADNSGNILFYGTALDSTFFGSQLFRTKDNSTGGCGTGYATFIAKLSAAGSWQFVKELCNRSSNTLNAAIRSTNPGNPSFLAADNANNVYAIVNSGTQNDSATVAGIKEPRGVGDPNNFIIKLDKNGKTLWVKSFGLGVKAQVYSNDRTYSISYTANNLYIAGELLSTTSPYRFSSLYLPPIGGNYNYFVAKADTSGTFKWATFFYGASITQGFGVAAAGSNVYTCGYYVNSINSLGNLNGGTVNISSENLFFGKLKDQYIHLGAITPTNIIPGCTITIPFTSTGLTFSNTNRFTAEISNASGDFTTPTAIGTTTSTGTGSITATIPASLPYGSGYIVRIRSSDTLKTGYNYYAYADTGYKLLLTCPPPFSGFTTTNVTGTSATLNWTAVGCAAGYKVQYRIKGTTAWTTKNIATNTPTISLTGLTVNTAYQWHVVTKCINNGTISFSAFSAIKQFTTASAFIAKNTTSDMKVADGLAVSIQPNPAKTNALLMINGVVKNAAVSLSDLTGKILWKMDGVNTNHITLPVQHLAAGIYLVKLVNGSEIRVVKLVKE